MQHSLFRSSAPLARVIHPLGIAPLFACLACTADDVSLGSGRAPIQGPGNAACPDGVVAGNVVTSAQEHIDALEGCEEISGDLWIIAFEGMDLRPLGSLRVVRSNLIVGAHPPNVESAFQPVPTESLEGLESLERVSSLSLLHVSVPDLSSLSSLTTVRRDATSQWNQGSYIEINGCNQLRDLQGLENLITWDMAVIEDNASLESLDGLATPWEAGVVRLSRLPRLRDIGGLAGADSIDSLWLDQTGLENVDSLGVASIGHLEVTGNPELRDLGGIQAVRSFKVRDNAKLARLPEMLHAVGLEIIEIGNNPELLSVPRFGQVWSGEVPSLGGPQFIEIYGNAKLLDVVLPMAAFGHHIVIQDNPSLDHLDMAYVQNVDLLSIRGNASLSDVTLDSLETVDELQIVDNPQLSTAGFAEVRSFSAEISGNLDSPAP